MLFRKFGAYNGQKSRETNACFHLAFTAAAVSPAGQLLSFVTQKCGRPATRGYNLDY